jgi:RNA polymerase sigma-70 factor, ECF subfamily
MGTVSTTPADAFRVLYDANEQRVRGLLTRMVGRQNADDLAQTVFVKVAKALPDFRGDAEASTWLYRIAANTAVDWLRSRPAHEAAVTVPLPEAPNEESLVAMAADRPASPEEELAHKDMHDCIRGEIAKLPEPYRDVLLLSMLGEINDEEIAETLGISQGNAKVRLHRARQEFKKIIAARCDFYRNELSCKPSSPDCCPASPASGSGPAGL